MPKATPPAVELFTIDEASALLGYGYSRRSIFRRISSGDWKEGTHWIDDRRDGSTMRMVRVNMAAVQALRQTPAAAR